MSGQIQTSFGLILSFSSVRVLNDGKISWVLVSMGYVKSSSTHASDKLHVKQSNTCLCKKYKRQKPKEKYLRQGGREPLDNPFPLPYSNEACNTTEVATEPVDPATEQNQ